MFGQSDLIVIAAVERAFEHLRNNPSHLEFILNFFDIPEIRKSFGRDYIKNCIDYINNNRVLIKPYLFPDLSQIPSFVVGATSSEVQQYMGSYGETFSKTQSPATYATFDVINYENSWIYVSPEASIEKKVWVGMWLTAGDFAAKIKSVMLVASDATVVELDRPVLEGTSFTDWKAQMCSNDRVFTCGSSMERATIQGKLTTSGDIATHRVMCTVIRYALKYERLYMDDLGLQNTVVSQGMPTVTDDEAPIYESMFTIEGDLHDFFIEKETVVPSRFGFELIAKSDDPEQKCVVFDGE